MKLFMAFLLIGCLVVTNVYGLEQEEKKHAITIYNFTADQYKVIIGLLEDLGNSMIDTTLAEKKLGEWKERYRELTQDPPPEAQKMCGLMTEMIDLCEELVDDYRPNHQKTKDLLEALEEVKVKFIAEMIELKYTLH
ncbi:hypothetical protein ACFL5X_00530 [Candidatus Omnitrophota bacterium]